MISVVPGDTGKPSSKSKKATVRDGDYVWEDPLYESIKFNRDPKSGKIHQRMYYFIVGTVLYLQRGDTFLMLCFVKMILLLKSCLLDVS